MQLQKEHDSIIKICESLKINPKDFLGFASKYKLPLHHHLNNYPIATGKYPYKAKPPEKMHFGRFVTELCKNGKKTIALAPVKSQTKFTVPFHVYLSEQILVEFRDADTGVLIKKLKLHIDYEATDNNKNIQLKTPAEDHNTHLHITQNVTIKKLSVENHTGYVKLPVTSIQQLIHQDRACIEFLDTTIANEFKVICESDKNTLPTVTIDEIYIHESTLSNFYNWYEQQVIDYKHEAAKDKWAIWDFAALLSKINPKRIKHIRSAFDDIHILQEGHPIEKSAFEKNLDSIKTWSLMWNISSTPYDLINRALVADLNIPEELLTSICAKAANESTTFDCYPMLYKEILKLYPQTETQKQKPDEGLHQKEGRTERNTRWQTRAEEIFYSSSSHPTKNDLSKQIHAEDLASKRPNCPSEERTVYRNIKLPIDKSK